MVRLATPIGIAIVAAAVVAAAAAFRPDQARELQFVVTADAHYGLTRAMFRGRADVGARVVNQALVVALNTLPDSRFPDDHGLNSGRRVGGIDFVVEAGDVTNREEQLEDETIQPAAISWLQFASDYLDGVHVLDHSGHAAPVLVVPGNHEASNAVGFHKPMVPPTDPMPLIDIYNRMLRPATLHTAPGFDYQRDRIFYTRDIGGVHLVFLHIWPDSAMRARMESDFARVGAATPIFIFTHDQPDGEAKHFINPNGAHDINAVDRFENLLVDRFADGAGIDSPSLIEQAQFEAFLTRHPNVVAYFHGNSNWHQVYDWNGPGRAVRLHTVRVDSPMKGALSSVDETRLSFEVVTVDADARSMTVRECLWNADPDRRAPGLRWGDTTTIAFGPSRAAAF